MAMKNLKIVFGAIAAGAVIYGALRKKRVTIETVDKDGRKVIIFVESCSKRITKGTVRSGDVEHKRKGLKESD
jgi:hypothetical protein